MSHDPTVLPGHLPVPIDDGAADHLRGAAVPAVYLTATSGDRLDLRARSAGRRLVVFAYPRTGRPGIDPPTGWDDIPGARGCTPEACSFRDRIEQLTTAGAEVVGLSTQAPDYQLEAATRLHLPYPLLSDVALVFTNALRLPTLTVEGMTLLRRLTLVIQDGFIEQVLYPVFPPSDAAANALAALM